MTVANGFKDASGKEDGALIIVGNKLVFGIKPRDLLFEIVLVVYEIDLHPGRGNGSHLDDQRVICVIDVEVHSAQADDLMQLVTALIDNTKTRHKHTDFAAALMNALGNLPCCPADVTLREKRLNCLTDV